MKKLNLKDIKKGMSRDEMRGVKGGYSWLYCTWHFLIGTIPGGYSWDMCRQA